MKMYKKCFLLGFLILFTVLNANIALSSNFDVTEVLSVKTGKGPKNIFSQFVDTTLEPFNGFAVDSQDNIMISDSLNNRIMRFKGNKLGLLTTNMRTSFIPDAICLTEDGSIFAHNIEKEEIASFSPDGKFLRSYNPGSVFGKENRNGYFPIRSFSCGSSNINIVFGVYTGNVVKPVYLDEYDKNFKLIARQIFEDMEAYNNSQKEKNKLFEKHFKDTNGNEYGYSVIQNWYGKFLPLLKYSKNGVLLTKIDGKVLSEHTKYKVYDYYTLDKIVSGWIELKGKEFLIVNWYVTEREIIYALLANKDFVKVLKITAW